MNKTFGTILAVVAFLSAGSAYAGGVYVTGGITATDLDVDSIDTQGLDRTAGINVGVGYDVNDWLAVEGTYTRFGSNDFTYQSISDTFGGTDVAANIDARAFTGWIVADPTVATVANMPVKVIGRVGYANVRANGSASDNDFAYGAGVGLGVTENVDVVLDYRTYEMDRDFNVGLNTVGLSAKYTF